MYILFASVIFDPGSFQLDGYIFGGIDIACNDIKSLKLERKKGETWVAELESEFARLKGSYEKKESGFKSNLEAAKAQADKAEKNAGELRKEI